MKKLEINIPLFDKKVTVLYADDLKTVDDYIRDTYRYNWAPFSPDKGACTYSLPTAEIIIAVSKDLHDRYLVHETGHATFELLELIGINPVKDQESFCYIQDYIFDKINVWRKEFD